jgi:hypothetical protein
MKIGIRPQTFKLDQTCDNCLYSYNVQGKMFEIDCEKGLMNKEGLNDEKSALFCGSFRRKPLQKVLQ